MAKPERAFFDRLVTWAGLPPEEIVYVGDHRDNDIVAPKAAGLRTAHVRRGPWGYLWANDPAVVASADWRIDSLLELPGLLLRTLRP